MKAETAAGSQKRGGRGLNRRGVALIIVLGFLALMVMMAVSFLTHARIERMVAAFSLDAQRGRQLVRTALAAAMNDYSLELYDRLLMLPPTNHPQLGDMRVFPSVAPTPAVALPPAIRTIGQAGVTLMGGEAYNYIPRRYLTPAVSNTVAGAQWILARENPLNDRSRILGRYAYVCFDMSGGIDANWVARPDHVVGAGDPTNRPSVCFVGLGTDANRTLEETKDPSEFKRLRTGWHGFDTLAEIILLTDGHYIDGQSGFESGDTPAYGKYPETTTGQRWRDNRLERFPALDKSKVNDLVPYSLAAYRGVYDIAMGWRPELVRSCESMTNWGINDWIKVMTDLRAPMIRDQLVDANQTAKALMDYVSPSRVPQGVDYPSSKNVPMLNELRAELELQFDAATTQLFLIVRLDLETWYPFPSRDNMSPGGFIIPPPPMSGGFDPRGPEGVFWWRCRLANGQRVRLEQQSVSAYLVANATFNNGRPHHSGQIEYRLLVRPENPAYTNTVSDQLQIRTIVATAQVMLDGQLVDQMDFEKLISINLGDGGTETLYYEGIDPRLNHLMDNWQAADAATLDNINQAAILAGYGVEDGEGLYMYCRNGPMKSPGEFGFISTGRPWETIDLCTEEGAKLLARIVDREEIVQALNSEANNKTYYTNATINPNTSSMNVLMAAFTGLTRQEVPNLPDVPAFPILPLTAEETMSLAASIMDAAKTKRIEAVGGAFMAGSDWVRVPAMRKGGYLSRLPLNKNQRESLIRNTWGLFSVSDSLFTVLVVAQPIKEGPNQVGIWGADDMIVGERRAVALVWRDPTPSGPRGQHEMYVRMFKMLDE